MSYALIILQKHIDGQIPGEQKDLLLSIYKEIEEMENLPEDFDLPEPDGICSVCGLFECQCYLNFDDDFSDEQNLFKHGE